MNDDRLSSIARLCIVAIFNFFLHLHNIIYANYLYHIVPIYIFIYLYEYKKKIRLVEIFLFCFYICLQKQNKMPTFLQKYYSFAKKSLNYFNSIFFQEKKILNHTVTN